jgi:heptosyltransferase-3
MRLLFIKLKHIGDTLLLTPTLAAVHATHPSAQIWVVVRRGCEGILAGCTVIDRLLTVAEPEKEKRSMWNWWEDFRTALLLRRQRFDYAFELTDGDRGRWLCGLSGAQVRCANDAVRPLNWWWRRRFDYVSHFDWRECHRAEKDFFTVNDCLSLGREVPPLEFNRARVETWNRRLPDGNYAVIHPGTRWQRKRWPEAKWIEVGRRLLEQVGCLIISVGPDPEETKLAASLAGNLGSRAISTEGKLSWAQLAGVLYGAKLLVSLDTAAMHLAAACQCPTVAIFGASVAAQWRPWRVRHRLLQPDQKDLASANLIGDEAQAKLIQKVELPDVLAACDELLRGSLAS